ncbi:MAG: RNA polymerase-binding protein DksA [Steroidobacteraceae bacterium]
MSAKKPAAKASKGKKAAPAKSAAKKSAALKRPAARKTARPVAHKSAPGKSSHPSAAGMSAAETSPEPMRHGPVAAAGAPLRGRVPVSPDNDEGELIEPGSLLAGPRNVQPYIPKRGEQYMSKEQLEHFRNILNTWKRDLMEEVDRTVSHMKDEAANFPDPSDRATQEEEFSLELRTRDRERKLIRKIDEALKRIEDGSYGYCLETGEEIGIKRLEARPVATLSIEAQERRERREKQYGDRDDRYR